MFKFKFKKPPVLKLSADMRTTLKDVLSDNQMLSEVGKVTVERLRYQARIGQPFNVWGGFPELKQKTVERREYLAQYNTVHQTFAVPRSNLTITGRLLDSLGFVIEGPGKIMLEFMGFHPRYKGKNGLIGTKESKNQDIADGLHKRMFSVFDDSLNQPKSEGGKIIRARMRSIALKFLRRKLRLK